MNIARSISRWALALVIGVATSLWILCGAINLTIANRDVTKQWLVASGIYNNALTSALQVSSPQGETDSSFITPDILRQAISQTFDPTYLRQSFDTVIDATYDWLEGKSQAITFSIAVQEQATVFRSNLTALIVPKLQALPVCAGKVTTDTNKLTCLPAGVNATDYANQLTRPSGDTTFLNTPLTQATFEPGFPKLGWLPIVFSWVRISFWVLPLLALVLAGLYVSVNTDKFRGIIRLGRHLTISGSVPMVAGLLLWFATGAIDLSQAVEGDPQQAEVVAALVNPLVHTILPDIGRALALCSGAVVLVGVLMWLGSFLWQRRSHKKIPVPESTPIPTQPADLPKPQPHPPRKVDM